MKNTKLILSLLLFAACAIFSQRILSHSWASQAQKNDYAEINHIKYGLLSVNKWKEHLSKIVSEEIKNLNLTSAKEPQFKKIVERQLSGLIDEVDEKIREKNAASPTGWIKQAFINTFVDLKDVKSGIPEYADAILTEMTKDKTASKLKDVIQTEVKDYLDKTFESKDVTPIYQILSKNSVLDVESAKTKIQTAIVAEQKTIYRFTWATIALAVILFAIAGFSKETLPAPQYIILVLTLMLLLGLGVTVPMIDMEAKISELSFTLANHPVSFTNQVLFFQSKSILDVFWIMITHKDFQMKVVGILMVGFSIIFPLMKMLSSLLFYYNFRKARENKWIQFFVLKSGKWSMTDVLIVAIFMAYIGFNGIINSQFATLNSLDKEMVMLTTNGTSLQPGFYIFLTYTILALLLSEFLIRKPKEIQL